MLVQNIKLLVQQMLMIIQMQKNMMLQKLMVIRLSVATRLIHLMVLIGKMKQVPYRQILKPLPVIHS